MNIVKGQLEKVSSEMIKCSNFYKSTVVADDQAPNQIETQDSQSAISDGILFSNDVEELKRQIALRDQKMAEVRMENEILQKHNCEL